MLSADQINPVQVVSGILLFAILVEAVVENIVWTIEFFRPGEAVEPNTWNWQRLVASAVSIGGSVIYNIDLFEILGFETTIPIVGAVLTGIIISRGANFVNDILSKLGDRP